MTDEEFCFKQEIREKKMAGRGIFHRAPRKRGIKGAVKLHSDYMTEGEKRKMNGEVKSYNLSKPMDWKTYKKLPEDAKKQYWRMVDERFSLTPTYAEKLFGVTKNAIIREMKKYFDLSKEDRRRMTKDNIADFLYWLHGERADQGKPQEKTEGKQMEPKSGEITFSGPLDGESIKAALLLLIGAGRECKVTVNFSVSEVGQNGLEI